MLELFSTSEAKGIEKFPILFTAPNTKNKGQITTSPTIL